MMVAMVVMAKMFLYGEHQDSQENKTISLKTGN